MSSPQLQLALWIIQPAVQTTIAVIFYRRKLHKQFPAFFLYIVAQVPIFCVELPFYLWDSTHWFYVYWSAASIDLVLTFRIIHEIFVDVFKPYHALRDLGNALFKWAALIMVLVSIVLIVLNPTWEDPFANSILVVQRCVRVVQCGLVIFLLAFCRNLGVSWRRLSFGIALGFGLISGSELLTTALFSGGRMDTRAVGVVITVSYELAMLVWAFYSLVSKRPEMVPVLVPQRWDEALMDIQAPTAEADSLIPMFEHMVDQALSKTGNTHA